MKNSLFFLFLSLFTFHLSAQNAVFENGVRKGILKFKLKTELIAGQNESTSKLDLLLQSLDVEKREQLRSKITKHKGRNLKRLFPRSTNASLENKHKKHGLHLWYTLDVDESSTILNLIEEFSALSIFDIVEGFYEKKLTNDGDYKMLTDKEIKTFSMSNNNYFNDPFLGQQWNFHNTGQLGISPSPADINMYAGWDIQQNASDIIVSIHDYGVDVNHPDLQNNIWVNEAELNGTPGVDDDGNGYIDDVNGWNFREDSSGVIPHFHATHIAGIIGAENDNGIGVSGIAGGSNGTGVKMMTLDWLDSFNVGMSYVYAADNGAVISQNSWTFGVPDLYEQSTIDAINYFIIEAGNYAGSPMKGGLVVFCTGNDGADVVMWPACYINVLAVTSIGADSKKADYSTYSSWVDLSAPGGHGIFIGDTTAVLSTMPNSSYGYAGGTSMAAPHVVGVAALVLSKYKHHITPLELEFSLRYGANNIDQYNPGYENRLGSGLIDAQKALDFLSSSNDSSSFRKNNSSVEDEIELTVYPNPASSEFKIYSEEYLDGEIRIYSTNGQLVTSHKVNSKVSEISVSDYKKGLYFIKIIDKKGKSILKKILVE
ncbi:S8 family serine peptidase [Flammeovirga aprica]|uniref:S8 family serine peptidase n=1 Tax=Flammeovirga aprica JL-4 TaxID=694437 RepID=A0A7X9XAK8_9BACT|nr:S8 family serine peptidase [Flammeovirga aprica]NME69775.1 S8 family serine peptidase [Flammeovirga aprica JL-4]